MASIIRIKRSTTAGDPSTLGNGELAYSAADSSVVTGGDRLYIGSGTETAGNAATHIVVGGKFFTDMLDHAKGTLTANSAIITDANSKIDNLKVDNIDLNGNTVSVTNTNGNLTLAANGTGFIDVATGPVKIASTAAATGSNTGALQVAGGVSIEGALYIAGALAAGSGSFTSINNTPIGNSTASSGAFTTLSASGEATFNGGVKIGADTLAEYIQDVTGGQIVDSAEIDATYDDTAGTTSLALKTTTVTSGSYGSTTKIPTFTVDTKGRLSAAGEVDVGTNLSIAGDTGTDTVSLLTDTLTVAGGEGVDVAVTNNTITISGEDASSSNKGIASFSTAGFSVTAGNVVLSDTVVQGITTDSGAMNMAGNAITIVGGEGVDVTHSGTTITVAGEVATGSNLGVASFNSADFSVTAGAVTIKTAGVGNAQLENSSLTIGSTTVALGATSTTLAGLQQLDVDNIRIDGNEISSTNTNGNISLNPNGTGVVDVNNSRITSLADPTGAQDAATKSYVDSVAEGLAVKPAVRAATTANLTATYNNGTSGVGATLTIAATASLNIDGVTDWAVGNGILVKDQTNPVQNGRYFVSTVGNISTAWVLTRCSKCDQPTEIPSMYVFVQEGTVYASTGWVASVEDSGAFDVGVDDITFIQFSGAGTYLAGDALGITGSTFNVLVAAAGGIEISADALQLKSSLAGTGLDYSAGVLSLESTIAGSGLSYTSGVIDLSLAASGGLEVVSDALQLKSTVAGAGLTLTSGVLDIVGTANRISVDSDSIDIASTYVGQTSITTLGTITTGTWNASTIAANRGGTGLTSYSIGDLLVANSSTSLAKLTIGASGSVLQSNGTTLVYGDIDGGTYA
jgi:hypothetical protein